MVGNIPSDPTATGAISNLFGSQSLVVIPCCSGPAPMIIEAQFGLLTVGMTARAWSVLAPDFINWCKFGVAALRIPSGLSPSTPMITTCSTPGT